MATGHCARCDADQKDAEYQQVEFRVWSHDGETYCEFCLEDVRDDALED